MIVNSVRFGQLEVPDDKIITMEKPILGFEQVCRYCLVEVDEIRPFLWLQAVDEPALAFLVVNPLAFYPNYKIEVNSKEIGDLDIVRASSVETYAIVTVPEDPKEMSVNLQGPILINTENGRAKQLVLVNSDYQVRHILLDCSPVDSHEEVVCEHEPVGV